MDIFSNNLLETLIKGETEHSSRNKSKKQKNGKEAPVLGVAQFGKMSYPGW